MAHLVDELLKAFCDTAFRIAEYNSDRSVLWIDAGCCESSSSVA